MALVIFGLDWSPLGNEVFNIYKDHCEIFSVV